eukprot:1387129-Amorphochlora_amoeboformis.AAC.1
MGPLGRQGRSAMARTAALAAFGAILCLKLTSLSMRVPKDSMGIPLSPKYTAFSRQTLHTLSVPRLTCSSFGPLTNNLRTRPSMGLLGSEGGGEGAKTSRSALV